MARTHPHRIEACVETRVWIARTLTRGGPVTISRLVGRPASTVGRPTTRAVRPAVRPDATSTPTRVVGPHRRQEARQDPGRRRLARPGRTVTVGHRRTKIPTGYDFARTVIDDHFRLAYAEIHDDEK